MAPPAVISSSYDTSEDHPSKLKILLSVQHLTSMYLEKLGLNICTFVKWLERLVVAAARCEQDDGISSLRQHCRADTAIRLGRYSNSLKSASIGSPVIHSRFLQRAT